MIAADIARAIDPVRFAVDCGVTPDPWQADLLSNMPRRALLLCSRQSGKSTVSGLIAAHKASYESGALVVIVSPSQRQSAEMLLGIKRRLANLEASPDFSSESVLKLELANQSRILALPGTERTIRGLAGVSCVIIDEASRVEDELIAAVRPMMATRPDANLIALTTPAGKRGWFYDQWHNGDPSWTRVRVAASDCPRISAEFLEEERRSLGQARFSEEYELQFRDSDEAAFPVAVIDAAFTREVQPLWA